MKYLPNTEGDRAAMLRAIGVSSVDELFSDVPEEARLGRPLDLPGPLSDVELLAHMRGLAGRNRDAAGLVSFLGGGAYDHYVPAVVGQVLSRGEFYTAYTPYQAEISQGVLQSMYEFQSLVCQLTGMDVANASMYDGATAMTEAALISASATGRRRIAVSAAVHPEYRRVLKTYAWAQGLEVVELPFSGGVTDPARAREALGGEAACLIVQNPNFFGAVEPARELGELARGAGALFVVSVDPISLGVLAPPGDYGADIVVGEGQPLGNPMSFGGPFLGIFAARDRLVRRMPGRIAGATVDAEGRRGFVLTLQTREQHIRREKATSNICSNEALCALAATVYLSLMGRRGMAEVARLCLEKAHYLRDAIAGVRGFEPAFTAPFFKEFVVKSPVPVGLVNARLLEEGMLGGLDLGGFYPGLAGHMLICVTEKRTRDEMDRLVRTLEGIS